MADRRGVDFDRVAAFGPFRLYTGRRLLVEGDRPVRLGSRAIDILMVLVERAGELVTKEELIAAAWPDTVVDEGNLRVHIAALRRVLGDGPGSAHYLSTSPGRGYSFVAPVDFLDDAREVDQPVVPEIRGGHSLPSLLGRILGRGEIINMLALQLPRRRFMSVVGPGGIGKTTVALSVAERLLPAYPHGVQFVDLATITESAFVPSALASVLGRPILSENPLPALISYLKDKRMLLVLDSCDHVIQAAAGLAEAVVRGAPDVHVLATSREPLRAEGERVVRLGSLDYPPPSTTLTAADAMTYSAIQLFVDRASANNDAFALTDADAPIAAEICRKLDGIALAIELAAGRIDAFGVGGLAARLDDRFSLLTNGRRTALPRQQALGATFDWSYDFLPEAERVILRRLSAFAGSFTWEAAFAVAGHGRIEAAAFDNGVADLVSKSLLTADVGGAHVLYRLLDTTRVYAAQKLAAAGETERLAALHASYFRSLFEKAELESQRRPAGDWLAEYGNQIDNLRAALNWAFAPGGDPTLGIALTIAAVPLWMQLSLVEECRARVERALGVLDGQQRRGGVEEMKLQAARGSALLHQKGSGPDIVVAWTRCLELAEAVDDLDYRLRALWGLWADQYYGGDLKAALRLVDRYRQLAERSPDPVNALVGERVYALALHCLGDQVEAKEHLENVLRHYRRPPDRSDIIRFQYDQRVSAGGTLMLANWLLGLPDQAMRGVEANVEEALGLDHTLSLCSSLANIACPIALSNGALDAAERYIDMLMTLTVRNGIAVFNAWARCFKGSLLIKRGQFTEGLSTLRSAFEDFPYSGFALRYSAFRTELAESLGRAGEIENGLREVNDAIERAERNNERWCWPEMLRVKADLLLLEDRPGAEAAAEDLHLRALAFAEAKQTLAWTLRTSASIARLRRRQGRAAEGRAVLQAAYDRFTEGFDTDDLRMARGLLDELRGSP